MGCKSSKIRKPIIGENRIDQNAQDSVRPNVSTFDAIYNGVREKNNSRATTCGRGKSNLNEKSWKKDQLYNNSQSANINDINSISFCPSPSGIELDKNASIRELQNSKIHTSISEIADKEVQRRAILEAAQKRQNAHDTRGGVSVERMKLLKATDKQYSNTPLLPSN